MSNFKDQLAKDIDVFYNQDEFAEFHTIGGKQISVVIDNDLLQARKYKMGDGVYRGEILLRVRKSDIDEKPPIGKIIEFDGKKKRVYESQEEIGEYIITLEANKS